MTVVGIGRCQFLFVSITESVESTKYVNADLPDKTTKNMMKGMSGVSSTTISLYVIWLGVCEEELSMYSTEVLSKRLILLLLLIFTFT